MERLVIAIVIVMLLALPVHADPKGGSKNVVSKAADSAAAAPSATAKVATEATGAIVDVLTGNKETKTVTTTTTTTGREGSLPPGLAKKDKVPPGWAKGKKAGWGKEETETVTVEKEDSPLKAFLKKLLGGGGSSGSAQ